MCILLVLITLVYHTARFKKRKIFILYVMLLRQKYFFIVSLVKIASQPRLLLIECWQIYSNGLYRSTGDFRYITCVYVTSVLYINFECCTHPWLPGYRKLRTNMLVNRLSVKISVTSRTVTCSRCCTVDPQFWNDLWTSLLSGVFCLVRWSDAHFCV